MAQKNDTPALIVSLFLTLGLLGGTVWWLTRQPWFNFGSSSNSSPSGQPSSTAIATAPASPTASAPDTPTGQSTGQSTGQETATTFAEVENVPSGLFNYGGSTTWAPIRGQIDAIMQSAHPAFQLRYVNPPTGTPGSASGIRMLIANQLVFSQSSRSLKPDEYQQAEQRGFGLKEIPVAIEGIAIVVHPSLTIPGLTTEQLKAIYSGTVTNWNQVGGPDLPILPYSRRAEDGGTVEFFIETVLGGASFSNSVRLIPNTTTALREVANNPGGIYYASAPEAVGQCGTKPLPIGRQPGQFTPPYQEPLISPAQCPAQRNQINTDALKSGNYPLTRQLFVIVKQDGQTDQRAGEAYANLLLSDQGQALLNDLGFVRIR